VVFFQVGLAFFKLKRFEESAWALELASERDPESSDLQVRLGSAYLHVGDEEKASAALRKAIQINSGSKILNDSGPRNWRSTWPTVRAKERARRGN
jgi:Tfp pilus assembly protein PilF